MPLKFPINLKGDDNDWGSKALKSPLTILFNFLDLEQMYLEIMFLLLL